MEEMQPLKNLGHVVLVTSPFFGQMIPLLDFAKCLSVYYHVTFVISASKLDALKQRGFLVEHESNTLVSSYSQIDFIGIFDHNDDDYEISSSSETFSLSDVIDRMREPLEQLLFPESVTSTSTALLSTGSIDRPIDLIVSDMFVHMPIRNAYERNIIAHVFVPGSFVLISLIINCSMSETQSGITRDLASTLLETFSLAKGFICNSIDKLDECIVDDVRQQSVSCSNLPVRFVAPLISEKFDDKQNTDTIAHVKQWLDAQWALANKSSSVIYVAFGTVACLTSEQLVQIANALMPYPTIWSLKTTFHKRLSSSFIEDRKHLLLDWAPQRFILSHPAIRFFLSHGGWNSLLESMLAGKPVLVWPLFGDQLISGPRIEKEFGIGQCIQNTSFEDHQRNISTDEITQYFKQMFHRETEHFKKAQQIQQIIMHAKENSSRLYFEQIMKIIDDQVIDRTEKLNKL